MVMIPSETLDSLSLEARDRAAVARRDALEVERLRGLLNIARDALTFALPVLETAGLKGTAAGTVVALRRSDPDAFAEDVTP